MAQQQRRQEYTTPTSSAAPPAHPTSSRQEEEQHEYGDHSRPPTPSSSTLEVEDALSEPSILSSSKKSPPRTPLSHTLAIYSLLVFASFWGVLARLGLEWIGGYAQDQVFVLIWAQIVGCTIMGFVVERKGDLDNLYPPLYVMIGTGFCGSLTSFSTWMYDIFIAFSNLDSPSPSPSRFGGFLSGLANTLVTLGLSSISLQIGRHLSSFLPSPFPKSYKSSPKQIARTSLLLIPLGPLFYLGAIFLVAFGPKSWRGRTTFALIFAPPGVLLRYILGLYLNKITPSFPLGTFSANIVAVLIFSLTSLLSRRPTSSISCQVLKGVQDGFCGCLSTVSTFVVELRTIGRSESWRYFWGSWGVGQVVMVLILGSWVWSGEREGLCSSG